MARLGVIRTALTRTITQPTRAPSASCFPRRSTVLTSTRQYATYPPSAPRRFLSTTLLLSTGVLLVYYYHDSRSALHEHVAMPLMRLLDPETGHRIAVRLLSGPSWVRPKDRGVDGPELGSELFGVRVNNPVGIGAGFDKDGQAIDGLFDLGFGYVEIGSVTPDAQPGNPQPRFFRLEEDKACINRYGFNSLGRGHTLARLRARLYTFSRQNPGLFPSPLPLNPLPPSSLPRSLRPGHLLAVNLGKNKTSAADSNDDYIRGVRSLGPYADVVVINVSSPNTPGLRALQGRDVLEKLLREVVGERDRIQVEGLPRIAVKVACDLSEDEMGDVASAVRRSGVDGVIVSNTTVRRDLGLSSSDKFEIGGLSGKPLFPLALEAVRTLRPLLPPTIPLIGCGGISDSADAIAMARAGATLVQIYTTFGYRGVGTPRLLKDEISQSLVTSSIAWKDQIGVGWTGKSMGWDEGRLKRDSEGVKREAGMGELLKLMQERFDLDRLVAEAELALGQEGPMETGSRDKLMGGGNPSPPEERIVSPPSSIENAQPDPQGEETPRLAVGQERVEQVANNVMIAAVGGEPTGIDLRPVVVQLEPEARKDEWTRDVRAGQRRLV